MGKKKKGEKAITPEILETHIHRFVDVPNRGLVDLRIGVDGMQTSFNVDSLEDIPEDSVIKVVIEYRTLDQEIANTVLAEVVAKLRTRARYVRPPERIIIQEKRKRMEELKHDTNPLDAVELWVDKHPLLKGLKRKHVTEKIRDYLTAVEVKERPNPKQFSIREIGLLNFMPFKGEQVVRNIPDGLIGIVGRYIGQDGRSNRSGKSAFLDAFRYALHGEGRKLKQNEGHVFDGEDQMLLGTKLEFDGQDPEVMIMREYTRQGSTWKSQVDIQGNLLKVKDAENEIESLLGMSKEDFTKTCISRQGELKAILTSTSSQLKEDIIRWRGLGVWPSLEGLAKEEMKSYRSDIRIIRIKLEAAEAEIAGGKPTEAAIKVVQQLLKEENEHNAKLNRIDDQIDMLEAQLSDAEEVVKAKGAIAAKTTVEKEVAACQKTVEVAREKRSAALAVSNQAGQDRKEKGKQVTTGFDGVCPVDSWPCPRTSVINKDTQAAKERYAESDKIYQTALAKTNAEKTKCGSAEKHLANAEDQLREIDTAEKLIIKHSKLPAIGKIQAALKKIEKDKELSYIDTDDTQKELGELLSRKASYLKAKGVVKEFKKEEAETHTELRLLQYIAFMCGKFGIVSMLIEDALEAISSQVNSILSDLGTDHRLAFDSERELKKRAKVCFECGYVFEETAKVKFCAECGAERQRDRADELRPMICEGDRKQTYEQDSGAGKDLVALATRVAMSKFLGAPFLLLDEISGAFDEYHLAMAVKLLHKLPALGFRQVFIISHQKEIEQAVNNRIEVTRYQEEQRSTLESQWAK